jgi:ribosomal protein S18 acetylase RimI-like enzyme
MTTIIRPATIDDVETIYDMVHALADYLGHPDEMKGSLAAYKKYGFGPQAFYKALIAEKQGEQKSPLGLCIYYMTFSSWRGTPGVCVLDLYVDPVERGSGLGRQLMVETVIAGNAVGATFLNLSVHNTNETGQMFYERIGMKQVDREKVYLFEGEQFENLIRDATWNL